jgi:hypothetical protein
MESILIQTLSTVISMIVIGFITINIAKKTGLSDLQSAAREETTLLIGTQKERINMLEEKIEEMIKNHTKQIADLTSRIESLEADGKRDKKEIARLRKVITDKLSMDVILG